ncbi:MAG TPA: trypsin-like peptidase domain-containing protein [Candidatus Hydrogenedentes bacterium]|nr:trypsin-like peptidase domain-containing protein [Candidatus Hydrogenedentota bacterium]
MGKKKSRRSSYAFFLVLLLVCGARAQTDIDQSRRTAIVQAIEKAAPAVVSVNVVQVRAERVANPVLRDFWDLFYSWEPQYRLRKRQLNSVGSGFIFDARGYILTNYHVIEDADAVASVTLADGRVLDAEVVGADKRTDVAVLRVKAAGLPCCSLGTSRDLLIGEWVIAVGNPFGTLMKDPQPTVSVGVVSANHRRISPSVGEGERLYQDMIQTDAAINPGNSGGPLVNAKGEVVGVNTMIFSPSGGSVGLGFALPIDRVRRVADELIQHGRRRDPWAGFKVEDVGNLRPDFHEQLGVQTETGSIVVNILTTSPAYEAGLRPGDVIVRINGEAVTSSSDIDFALWNMFVGDTATLVINRRGAERTLRFPIVELSR